MVRTRTVSRLSPDERQEVLRFLDDAHALDGARLNDHLHTDLAQEPRPGFHAILAHDEPADGPFVGRDRLVGYAQASAGNEGFVVDAISSGGTAGTAGDGPSLRGTLLRALVDALPATAAITWWTRPDDHSAVLAASLGMQPDRQLLLMRRGLPIDATAGVELRPFVPGTDDEAWLEVNNAAFGSHGEQGGWTLAVLQQRTREPWFDAAGFLVHERAGRLAAFCWTKMHPGEGAGGSLAGEIYVIAVHPDFHGQGLGRALTVAGLQHMQRVGATDAMLYVDAVNASAVGLYEALGFAVAATEQSYRRPGAAR